MSAKVSPFRDEKYVADKNFIGHYHDQMSFLLAKEYDVDVEDIKPLVKEVFQPATNGFPEIKFQVLVPDFRFRFYLKKHLKLNT